ncbi:BQ5605_C009g05776 [Microbotryum silenes-dioicae]|uniref:BQ5605_C009g05776 protein n=1 Tax=Microbotryum silenes-dioicae TaxID=796604 RepID=A0A2X0N118_9BASI|nr:BQ5605_C009g05776 [Microbotryum silenes-dioicae]
MCLTASTVRLSSRVPGIGSSLSCGGRDIVASFEPSFSTRVCASPTMSLPPHNKDDPIPGTLELRRTVDAVKHIRDAFQDGARILTCGVRVAQAPLRKTRDRR